ncbi:MAG: hypothetical protein Q7U60_01325 [Candidatus Methanoperedens sp.]|nr:hypothetical protein [Candidatus Methanoperedens sp.]
MPSRPSSFPEQRRIVAYGWASGKCGCAQAPAGRDRRRNGCAALPDVLDRAFKGGSCEKSVTDFIGKV